MYPDGGRPRQPAGQGPARRGRERGPQAGAASAGCGRGRSSRGWRGHDSHPRGAHMAPERPWRDGAQGRRSGRARPRGGQRLVF